jgi:hypothetical protein
MANREHKVVIRMVQVLFILAFGVPPTYAVTQDVAMALRQIKADTLVKREVTLKDIGFDKPEILVYGNAEREIYFPVPAGLLLKDATLEFAANYLRADGGRTTLLLSLDGYPVSARAFSQDQGDASLSIGVDGRPRAGGFVRLGAVWSTIISDDFCGDIRTIGNILTVTPTTRLTYSFDTAKISDLATAWSALPPAPAILIASGPLPVDTFDAAWRLGVALNRSGRRAEVRSIPAVLDEVDLNGLSVPSALKSIPAFGALASGGRHKLATPAEVGALLALGAPFHSDIVVADGTLLNEIRQAFNALAEELAPAGTAAIKALAELRERAFALIDVPLTIGEVRLTSFGGRPVIAVASGGGTMAAGLFDDYWRRMLLSRSVVVRLAGPLNIDTDTMSLSALGGVPSSLNILASGDWTATFDLGTVASDGRVPSELEINVKASPGASSTKPVATVFLNDYLLGARRLDADGKPEAIRSRVPLYSLAPRNVLRVHFQRQPVPDHCREIPQAYPVAVLPTSYMRFEKANLTEDFLGMVPRFAGGGSLMVPTSYLLDASNSLPRVIRLVGATGLSPIHTRLEVAADENALMRPRTAFLAMDVKLAEANPKALVENNRLTIKSIVDSIYFDVSGLDRIGVAQVLTAGSASGVWWQTIGAMAPNFDQPFRLARGDVALVGNSGPLVEIDSNDPAGSRMVVESSDETPFYHPPMERVISWGVYGVLGFMVLFILLLAGAAWAKRQHRRSES